MIIEHLSTPAPAHAAATGDGGSKRKRDDDTPGGAEGEGAAKTTKTAAADDAASRGRGKMYKPGGGGPKYAPNALRQVRRISYAVLRT